MPNTNSMMIGLNQVWNGLGSGGPSRRIAISTQNSAAMTVTTVRRGSAISRPNSA